MIRTRFGVPVVHVAWIDEETGEVGCVLLDEESKRQFARVNFLSDLVADGGIHEILDAAKDIRGKHAPASDNPPEPA